MRVRRLRVERPSDLSPFFERYALEGSVWPDDALRIHLLIRGPTPEERGLLAAAAGEVAVLASGELPGSSAPESAPGLLLSGEASGFRELLNRLGAAPAQAGELARAVERALFPPRVAIWQLRTRSLELDRPLVMGIVNVTPDSFSDGGSYVDPEAAIRHGRELAGAGADMLDVGGESTRPGSERVEAEEELRRVVPVIAGLAGLGLPLSVDTTRAKVAQAALDLGAEVVNDVSALRFDPALADVAAASGAGVILMHMRGTPLTMQRDPSYQDVVGELLEFFSVALARGADAGIDAARCAVDPGLGFGKRLADNEELLYRLTELRPLGRPLVVGPSRKSFLDPEKRMEPSRRLPETIAASCLAALGGAHVLRVHDVGDCRRALEIVRRIELRRGED